MCCFVFLVVLVVILFYGFLVQVVELLVIDVYCDVNCGCCKDWIKYFEVNGFEVIDYVEVDMSVVKSCFGVFYSMGFCYIGVIDGKFVEGYVLVVDIFKLCECVDLVGVVVLGMLVGLLGMEMGDCQDVYQVVGLIRSGQVLVLVEYLGC